MYVLRDHYNGNPTILVHDWIINGCARFKMEDAPAILEEHEVPADVWQQALDVYTGTSTPEQIMTFKDDPHWHIRREVAKLGFFSHTLRNDSLWPVRLELAKLGLYPEQFKDDVHFLVRQTSTRTEHFQEIFQDDPCRVGHRKILNKLGGFPEKFINDPNSDIREVAISQLKELNRLIALYNLK